MGNTTKLRDQRLRILKGILDWEGEIGNSRVRELFDVQAVQASRLLADLRQQLGDRLPAISKEQKFRLLNPAIPCSDMELEEYASLLDREQGSAACFHDARVDLTSIKPAAHAVLRRACMAKLPVEIVYSSMANPKPAPRLIYPHVIVRVGRRWHTRAWCVKNQAFRDFALGRIRNATLVADEGMGPSIADQGWETIVKLRIVPHDDLGWEQRYVIMEEYLGNTAARVMSVRSCLLQYVIHDLRAAIDTTKEQPPEFQLQVFNPSEIAQYLFEGND